MAQSFGRQPALAQSAEPAPPASSGHRLGRRIQDTILAARDRLLADPPFQRWASRFPLTRHVARARARALFDLCAGFVYSQVLFAAIRLRLFEILAEGPLALDELAPRLGLPRENAARLLAAAAALDLVSQRGPDRYGLGDLGAALLGNPSIAALVEHHALLYADLADPVALLRGAPQSRALAGYWPYAGAARPADLTDPEVARYTALMAASQAMIAREVLDVYPLRRHRHLLDVGGGSGAFLLEAAARHPGLGIMLFDLPPVAARAHARFATAGLAARAQAFGGDFHVDPLPRGADVLSLIRVVHDHDDAAALRLLRAARAALPEDGTLLLAEPMAGTPGAEPVGDAYFGFYLMAMGRGRARRPEELAGLLRQSGFAEVRSVPTCTPLLTGLLVARPRPVGSRDGL